MISYFRKCEVLYNHFSVICFHLVCGINGAPSVLFSFEDAVDSAVCSSDSVTEAVAVGSSGWKSRPKPATVLLETLQYSWCCSSLVLLFWGWFKISRIYSKF